MFISSKSGWAALQQSDVIFSTYRTVLLVLILNFTYLVIISALLIIIDQKWDCDNIFWTYQLSSLQYCHIREGEFG